MAFSDSVKDFIMACEYANFVNVTDPDDIEDLEGYELNKGDFVYFLGIFCFNSERKLLIKCPDNNRFKIKISYELDGSFDRFETSVEYYSYFKGIWGSSQVDLIDVESSLEIASPLNDFSSNKQDSNIQVDNTKDNECKDSVPAIEESSTNTQSTGEDLKSVMDRLLEQQYWNTELARENEDLSKNIEVLRIRPKNYLSR